MYTILVHLAMPPWSCHPGYTPQPTRYELAGYTTPTGLEKGAMGSKRGVRNVEKVLEVNLERTIWALAPFSAACCKNQPVLKAPDYLGLSNPCKIITRPRVLP